MKCPYCQRPLHGLGLHCRACRRYVLGWTHYLALALGALLLGFVLLQLFVWLEHR